MQCACKKLSVTTHLANNFSMDVVLVSLLLTLNLSNSKSNIDKDKWQQELSFEVNI